MTQQTLSIIKPDAVAAHHIGGIIEAFHAHGMRVAAMKMLHLSPQDAGEFYIMHKDRPFYGELVEYMTSGPVVVLALEGHDVIKRYRDLMGATNPADAEEGTLRQRFGQSLSANAVHGSDSEDSAVREIAFFFAERELVNTGESE